MFRIKSSQFKAPPMGSPTIIGNGSVISGNIQSEGDIRIDGILKGNLSCRAKILLGPDAIIEGDIIANQADICGRVLGSVSVNDLLYLHGNAVVEGNIRTARLQIEESASFNGEVKMGANVVDLGIHLGKAANE